MTDVNVSAQIDSKVAERAMLVANVGRMVREGFTITDRKVRFGSD